MENENFINNDNDDTKKEHRKQSKKLKVDPVRWMLRHKAVQNRRCERKRY